MGNLNLRIKASGAGFEGLDEMRARIADLSPVFQRLIPLWASHNMDKFARGQGMESEGADQGSSVWWAPLVPATMRAKRHKGYPDSIMVATGSLKQSLTSEDAFAQFVSETQAVFGTPLDEDDAQKVGYNWTTRPTVFLDQQDKLMIEREIENYLNMGADYAQQMARAGEAARLNAAMDAELAMVVEG